MCAIYLFCVCMCVSTHATALLLRSEDNLRKLVLFFHCVCVYTCIPSVQFSHLYSEVTTIASSRLAQDTWNPVSKKGRGRMQGVDRKDLSANLESSHTHTHTMSALKPIAKLCTLFAVHIGPIQRLKSGQGAGWVPGALSSFYSHSKLASTEALPYSKLFSIYWVDTGLHVSVYVLILSSCGFLS